MRDLLHEASELLFREAHYLDAQRWDEWLGLFVEDCEYWVPAWKSEHEPTVDPKRELSMIYYARRASLEERVARARSGRAPAAVPLPRTHHALSNIVVEAPGDASIRVLSNWCVHQFLTKRREVEVLFGRYEHDLERRDEHWRIRRKKITLLNDYLPAMVDFYSL